MNKQSYAERMSKTSYADAVPLAAEADAALAAANAEVERLRAERKTFRVSGYGRIPWSVAEKAHEKYGCRHTQSLERLDERGGFSAEEMDEFYPPWREESDENTRLRRGIAELEAVVGRAIDALDNSYDATERPANGTSLQEQTRDMLRGFLARAAAEQGGGE